MLGKAQTSEARAQRRFMQAFLDAVNTEEVVSSEGLTIKDLDFQIRSGWEFSKNLFYSSKFE